MSGMAQATGVVARSSKAETPATSAVPLSNTGHSPRNITP